VVDLRLGLNGNVNKSMEITASYALMRYRLVTQGQLELENREITHAAAVRAWMEQETAEYQAEQNDVRTSWRIW
jgi:hypothetical protein